MKLYYYYFVIPLLLLQHASSSSDGGRNGQGGGLLRRRPLHPRYDGMVVEASKRQDSVTMATKECDDGVTENPFQKLAEGCPCFNLDTLIGLTTDLNRTEDCNFHKHDDDGNDQCQNEYMGFHAYWNEEDYGSRLEPYGNSNIGFMVERYCDYYGDSGGYVLVRNDWFEDEPGVIRMDLGQDGGVLTFVPPALLGFGGGFDWNEVWPVFADVNGNPKDPSKWNSTVSFRAEERTFILGPYSTLTQDRDFEGLNTYDVNDYEAGSLECGEDFDENNDRFYIVLNGELLDSCPKTIVDNYTFDSSILDNIEEEHTTPDRMSCYADIGRSKGTNDSRGWQSTWESHSYSINFETTADEYEDCVNVLTAFKDTLPTHCDISN